MPQTRPNQVLRKSIAAAAVAIVIGFIIWPFVMVPPWHFSARRSLHGIWVSCSSRITDQGVLVGLDGPVRDRNGEVEVCPACGNAFVWATSPKSGDVMVLQTANGPKIKKPMYFVKCRREDGHSKRWYLFSDGRKEYLSDEEVDPVTQTRK